MQDLITGEVMSITNSPGYDETTIFSPDEKLGIVMSTRFSPKTNMAILGLIPRPYSWLVIDDLIMYVYRYAISGVRLFRKGNIGPVLIDLKKSIQDEKYNGTSLADLEGNWVFCSPISWHPSSKKAIWLEMFRGDRKKLRIRKLVLIDYIPSSVNQNIETPDRVFYGISGFKLILKYFAPHNEPKNIKIAGKYSGYIEYKCKYPSINLLNTTLKKVLSKELSYYNYSDDNKTFYNGYERLLQEKDQLIYEADLLVDGAKKGEMKLKINFVIDIIEGNTLVKINKRQSYGYTRFGDTVIKVEDLEE